MFEAGRDRPLTSQDISKGSDTDCYPEGIQKKGRKRCLLTLVTLMWRSLKQLL